MQLKHLIPIMIMMIALAMVPSAFAQTSISYGSSVSGSISTSQSGLWVVAQFNGSLGDVVNVVMTTTNGTLEHSVFILNSNNQVVASSSSGSSITSNIEGHRLTANDTYKIAASLIGTGSYTVSLSKGQANSAPTDAALTQTSRRLGSFQVEWYCNNRGQGVTIINNNRDWACVKADGTYDILNQGAYNEICRITYNNSGAFAVRDQNTGTQAYDWSCYDNGGGATINTFTAPQAPPTGSRRLGGFQVEWYCSQFDEGAILTPGGANWACFNGYSRSSRQLTQDDYNEICRTTYNSWSAFAIQDKVSATRAYDWTCYDYTTGGYANIQSQPNQVNSNLGQVFGTLRARTGFEVNVRTGAGTEFDKIGRINWSRRYPILGAENGWYLIDFNGQTGYVAGYWVLTMPESTIYAGED